MTWLLTQMWALLGAAALIALIFGWGLRGALLRGKLRRSQVEADLARTELEQARTEIEGLYAAQRKLSDGSPELKADLEARDQHITALNEQIMSLKGDLEDLQAQASKTSLVEGPGVMGAIGTGIAGAAVGTLASNTVDDGAREELEVARKKIDELEGQLAAAQAGAGDAGQAVALAGSDTGSVEFDKLRWQNDYLRTRLKVFEQKAGVQLSGEPPAGPEEAGVVADPVELPEAGVVVGASEDRETPDEELARLRWRNRYLEGRLAYLEEERSKEAPEGSEMVAGVAGAAGAAATVAAVSEAAVPVETEDVADTVDEADPQPTFEPQPQLEPEPEPEPEPVAFEPDPVAFEPEPDPAPQLDAEPDPFAFQAEPAPLAEIEPDSVAFQTGATPAGEAVQEPEASPAEPDLTANPQVSATTQEASADAAPPAPEPDGQFAAEPVTVERPEAADEPRSDSERDDLTRIEGIGPRIQDVLNSVGIYRFQQIASWTPANEAWVDDYLSFSGRVGREGWVAQAKALAVPQNPFE